MIDKPLPRTSGPSPHAAVARTVGALGYELVEVERSAGGLLRVFIDRVPGHVYPAGGGGFVTVEDCEAVTRQLQYALEVEGVDYARLEVSSPGLDRPLKTAAHFERFAGQQAHVTLKTALQGRKNFEGILQPGALAQTWRLVFNDGKAEQVLDFVLDDVREARLVPVLDFKGRRGKTAPADPAPAGRGGFTDGGREQ